MMTDPARRRALQSLAMGALGAGLAWHGAALAAPPPAQGGGQFIDIERFSSLQVAPRKVRVWLPAGYATSTDDYAVLYMHDGQNLFEPAASVAYGPWAVDTHLAALARAGKVRPTIVVGIWNGGADRGREYLPQAPLNSLPAALAAIVAPPGSDGQSAPLSDAYLRMLVGELKPHIDATFRTRRGRADTFLMGSSMGGLISLYALACYPDVFAGAACLSTHWPMTTNGALLRNGPDARVEQIAASYRDWLGAHLESAGRHRLYFDHGDTDLDALYGPYQAKVDLLLAAKGYREGSDLMRRTFAGARHNETEWRARLATPLSFLLAP